MHRVLVLSFVLISCGKSDRLAREGLGFLEQGDETAALTLFERSLKADKDNALAMYGKGMLFMRHEYMTDMGVSMLIRSVPRLSDPALASRGYLILAAYEDSRSRPQEAIRMASQAVSLAGEPEAYMKLADLHCRIREYNQCRSAFQRGHGRYPEHPGIALKLAELSARQFRDIEAAYAVLNKVQLTHKKDPALLEYFARLAYRTNRRNQALTAMEEAIRAEKNAEKIPVWEETKRQMENGRWYGNL